MIRPGPSRIAPATVPGGYVVQVYGTADGRLLVEAVLQPWCDVEAEAGRHADAAGVLLGEGEDLCLVFFDGDSGERVLPPGYVTGDMVEVELS